MITHDLVSVMSNPDIGFSLFVAVLNLSSRDTTPSIDENGKPFHVPLKETSEMVRAFNQKSKEKSLWETLHAFDL